MQKIKILYKSKTNLIESLLNEEFIEKLKPRTFFQKLFFAKKEYADIYFHSGSIENSDIENIKNASKVIVNSNDLKKQILIKASIEDREKVEVIYPSIDLKYEKPKDVKKAVCEKFKLDFDKKIILFTAKNFKTAGIKDFLEIVSKLNFRNIEIIIAGDKKQITSARFHVQNMKLKYDVLFLEDYSNIDEIFLASDLFLLPTYSKAFVTNVLKAMYCKCAVLTTQNTTASELIDVFATLHSPNDGNTSFKIDALLGREEDLKLIKNHNRKVAKEFSLEKNYEKMMKIVQSLDKDLNLNKS